MTGPDPTTAAERALEESKLAETSASLIQEIPLMHPAAKGAAYRERLGDIWDLLSTDQATDGETAAQKRLFQDVMMQVTDDGRITPSSMPRRVQKSLLLDADPARVRLLISDMSRALTEPRDVIEFARSTLADAVESLERRREGSPEELVDIVNSVMRRAPAGPGVSLLASQLYRYIQNQEDRSPGYYASVAQLGNLRLRGSATNDLGAAVMWTDTLDGLRDLVDEDASSVYELPYFQRSITGASFNLASRIATMLQNSGKSETPLNGARVLSTLATIAASFEELMFDNTDEVSALASSLGLETQQPADALTVLYVMAGIPPAWGPRSADLARLEASSAVISVATTDPGPAIQVGSRFFNAGVSLHAATQSESFDPVGILWARLLCNALGLIWSLRLTPDHLTAMLAGSGLDCAVNFAGAAAAYRGSRSGTVWSAVESYAPTLFSISRWEALRTAGSQETGVDLARLASSEEQFKSQLPRHQFDEATFVAATESVVAVLSEESKKSKSVDKQEVSASEIPLDPEFNSMVIDLAATVRGLFENLLGVEHWPLADTVANLTEARFGRSTFSENYHSGWIPAVDAGVCDQSSWTDAWNELHQPLHVLSPYLREFSLE